MHCELKDGGKNIKDNPHLVLKVFSYWAVLLSMLRDALLTSTINCVTSFISGFAIFSILGYIAHEHKVKIEDVATEGRQLILY